MMGRRLGFPIHPLVPLSLPERRAEETAYFLLSTYSCIFFPPGVLGRGLNKGRWLARKRTQSTGIINTFRKATAATRGLGEEPVSLAVLLCAMAESLPHVSS